MSARKKSAPGSPAAPPVAADPEALRTRINRFRVALGRHFVGKQPLIDLMTICAVAQEPLLLVGPPGTAKSDLVVKFRDALGIAEEDYFEYTLTRFTEPSQILGPIDIRLLREGRYVPFGPFLAGAGLLVMLVGTSAALGWIGWA